MMKIDSSKVNEVIYAKYNELQDVKKYIKDQQSIDIIDAKLDTLEDMRKLIKSLENMAMMDMWSGDV